MSDLSPFWDRLADKYAGQPIADQTAYRTKLARTQEFLQPDMALFEFGCGTGGTAIEHAPHVAHVRAVDFSQNMLDHARRRAAEAGITNITFEQGDIATMPIAPASYDVVLGLSILHLLEEPEVVIRKVHTILKPGGRFVSSTACLGNARALSFLVPIGKWLGKLPHITFLTHDDLRRAMTKAGFTIEHDWRPAPGAAVFMIARKAG